MVKYSRFTHFIMSSTSPTESKENYNLMESRIDVKNQLFPHCIVWTPIPFITWILPFIGHMGIGTSSGIIYDFAGPYYIGEGKLSFGKPTKYWQLTPQKVPGGSAGWDQGVADGCSIYRERMHNLCCDNCHSHVSKCLNIMQYDNRDDYNMVKLAAMMLIYSKYVSCCGFIKTWLPFLILVFVCVAVSLFL